MEWKFLNKYKRNNEPLRVKLNWKSGVLLLLSLRRLQPAPAGATLMYLRRCAYVGGHHGSHALILWSWHDVSICIEPASMLRPGAPGAHELPDQLMIMSWSPQLTWYIMILCRWQHSALKVSVKQGKCMRVSDPNKNITTIMHLGYLFTAESLY